MSHSLLKDFYHSIFPVNSKYITNSRGNSNIILSAPHGGGIKPINAPRRRYGNRSQDTYTRRLTELIINGLKEKPYYIYADIHRSIVDLNRDIEEATQGNKLAEDLWKDWNYITASYTDQVRNKFGRGLFIDIHSHNKSDYFELGYALKVQDYNAIKMGSPSRAKSTLYPILNDLTPQRELLFGDKSFETCIEFGGYKVLNPTDDKHYLNGGWNIEKNHGKGIGAVQIECPISVLKLDIDNIAKTLINAIEIFKERFLDV